MTFLSTPSARRATGSPAPYYNNVPISIHALREEGDDKNKEGKTMTKSISIHALREEGDLKSHRSSSFNTISIHALREEGDHQRGDGFRGIHYFYPRPPRGGRLYTRALCALKFANFYPRPPRGGNRR